MQRGILAGSPQVVGDFTLLMGTEMQSYYSKYILLDCFIFSALFFTLSFDSAVGLQMSSEHSVTAVRSDRPSSATKFGERMPTPPFFIFPFGFTFGFSVPF